MSGKHFINANPSLTVLSLRNCFPMKRCPQMILSRGESQEGGSGGKRQASLRHRNVGQRRMTENGRDESQESGTEGRKTGERGSHRP